MALSLYALQKGYDIGNIKPAAFVTDPEHWELVTDKVILDRQNNPKAYKGSDTDPSCGMTYARRIK